MNLNLKTAITAVASVAIVGAAAKNYLHVQQTEQSKRMMIELNKEIDICAIKIAQHNMTEKISSGEYPLGSLAQLQRDMQTEIEFQKIALRS